MTDSTGSEDSGQTDRPPTDPLDFAYRVFRTLAADSKAVAHTCILLVVVSLVLCLPLAVAYLLGLGAGVAAAGGVVTAAAGTRWRSRRRGRA